MTPRARVRATLDGELPDRIPNGLGATINSGMHLLAYDRLREALGLVQGPARMMSFEANALMELDVVRALGIDMVSLGVKINPACFWGRNCEQDWQNVSIWGREYRVPRRWSVTLGSDGVTWIDGFAWNPFTYNVPTNGSGCRLKCPSGGHYFDPVPLDDRGRQETLSPANYDPPRDYPEEWLRMLQDSAEFLHTNTDLAIVCDEMINDFQLAPGGVETWWMKLATEQDEVNEYLDKACEAAISQLRLLHQAIGDRVEMLQVAHDFGDLRGVQIGPDLWREVYKPHLARLFSEWHRITPMRIGLHSCGSIVDILPDLVACGLDVLNPVQVSARGMDPRVLKAIAGDELVFYGGSYDAVTNPVDTPAEVVYEQVARNIRALSDGGGYVFAGVHNLQGNVPWDHIEATLRAYRDCREYGGPS